MNPPRTRSDILAFLGRHLAAKGVSPKGELAALSVKSDLDFDSLDLMELFAALEESYGLLVDVDDYRVLDLDVLGNLADYVAKGGRPS